MRKGEARDETRDKRQGEERKGRPAGSKGSEGKIRLAAKEVASLSLTLHDRALNVLPTLERIQFKQFNHTKPAIFLNISTLHLATKK